MKKQYGYKLTLKGILSETEAEKVLDEVKNIIVEFDNGFSVFVDVTKIEIIPNDTKEQIAQLQKFCNLNGLKRTAVVVKDQLTVMQLSLLAKKTGISHTERYFDGSQLNFESKVLEWLESAKEPSSQSM